MFCQRFAGFVKKTSQIRMNRRGISFFFLIFAKNISSWMIRQNYAGFSNSSCIW